MWPSLHGCRAARPGSLLGCGWGQLKIGQEVVVAVGGWMQSVMSPALGNERKRILFAHTEGRASPPPHEPALAGAPGYTHAPSPKSLHSLPASRLAARPGAAVGSGVQAETQAAGAAARAARRIGGQREARRESRGLSQAEPPSWVPLTEHGQVICPGSSHTPGQGS